MSYSNGCHGAVNGMTSQGQVDKSSVQSDEVWTGVTYALAATLVYQVNNKMFKRKININNDICI